MADVLPWEDDPKSLLPQDVELPASPTGLHPAQQAIFDQRCRFNVVAAGRRFGKTWLSVKLACWYARHTHWSDGTPLEHANVWYISPTIELGLEQVAPLILEELGDECVQHHKVQNYFQLENGCRIYLKSANRPENLRGRALRFAILDEISIMRPGIWETIVRPMLVDKVAPALIIGTPIGKGKLYDLYKHAQEKSPPEWGAWQFKTVDNPHISADEVESAGQAMTASQFRQEFNADWSTGGGNVFNPKHLKTGHYQRGVYQLAAVFGSDEPFAKDAHALSGTESALIVLLQHPLGWHVISAQRGFWSVSETISRIAKAWNQYTPRFLALSAKDCKASHNLIQEYQRHHDFRTSIRFFEITEADDLDRIKWALQSRLKAGRITAPTGKGRQNIQAQLQDFPLEYANNELVQALSYFDQLPQPNFGANVRNRFRPLDRLAGY